MRAHDSDFHELIENLDIEFFLEREGVDYKTTRGSSGVQLNIRDCPSCGDTRWKVYLNAETGLGNCFICSPTNGAFNKTKFTRAHYTNETGNSRWGEYKAYMEVIAREQGWVPKKKYVEVEKAELSGVPDSIELPTHEGKVIRYLVERGVDAELCKHFSLRYCVSGKFAYRDPNGREMSQSYGKRIIIPIFDLEGNLVSFQGRDITGESPRRYLFPPGFASSGNYLYNGWNVVKDRFKTLYIAEGAFDVIAAYRHAKIPVVGSFGKSLSFNQVEELLKMKDATGFEKVVFIWDGEIQAALDAINTAEKIKSMGIDSMISFLPSGKDPDECTKGEFIQSLREAIDLSNMKGLMTAKAKTLQLYRSQL